MPKNENSLFPQIHAARYGDSDRKRRDSLFLPKLLEAAAADHLLRGEGQDQARVLLTRWADLESEGKLQNRKESELEGEFLQDVFCRALGHTSFSQGLNHWHLRAKYQLPDGEADAAIGFFAVENGDPPLVLIELKGPRVNIDRDRPGGRTPVQQCWDYLNSVPEAQWGIVSNMVSFRLYHKARGSRAFEHFTLQELRDDVLRFRQFYCLFSIGGLLPALPGQRSRAEQLLVSSRTEQQQVGAKLYARYHDVRVSLIRHLMQAPFDKSIDQAIHISQKLLDRIVFVAFCEQRGLLPPRVIQQASDNVGAFALVTNPQWHAFRRLFQSIDKGNPKADIPQYNGGLFESDPEVDGLELDDSWTAFFRELTRYDFENEVTVDVLGHIFEQSVTDLETLRLHGAISPRKPTKALVGKRKRQGIYYTPQFVTKFVIDQTLGACLSERTAALARKYGVDPSRPGNGPRGEDGKSYWKERLDELLRLKVCDPACGSGAFLIEAFDFLEGEYELVLDELCQLDAKSYESLRDAVAPTILGRNLFGVDLSREAVEITRLALWIRTAERGRKLTDLSHNIWHGNSIVDDASVDSDAFPWAQTFAEAFAAGGFDCVIGNPPYVKLQNFRRREPMIAAHLIQRYRSAKTGNFDLYLPFIERGLELLNSNGRLGFIAPSVWLFNEYGRGLRELVREGSSLEKFVDFKSFQVFQDATTYTAVQIFSPRKRQHVQAADASDGALVNMQFYSVPYRRLETDAWALVDDERQTILEKMRARSVPLEEAAGQIFQGLITSADVIYHLKKLGPGRFFSAALNGAVELEDELLKPLVSGEEAVPFATPPTDKYLLFPYLVAGDECRLFTVRELKRFKRCWAYLKQNESVLRARESGKFDDDQWYRFGRHQNIDKQELAKIGVPQTVNRLAAFIDAKGERYFNNVRINGILPRADGTFDLWYLLGILNSDACDCYFRSIAKPKDRGYFEANKQFIAPLPIPKVANQKPVAEIARQLADLHARVLAISAAVHRRFEVDLLPASLLQGTVLPPKLPRKLTSFDELSMPALLSEIERFAESSFKPQQRAKWDRYLSGEIDTLQALKREIADATEELNGRAFELYGLDDDDVRRIDAARPARE
ncbi:MAG: Eco57I restriction-modification methylase domain-containing protein [Planctomycetaceae bacterium]